jgi:hypothetical protein
VSAPALREFLRTGSRRERVRWALRIVTPWGLEWILWNRSRDRLERQMKTREGLPPAPDELVEEAIAFFAERGLNTEEVREGTMPDSALSFISTLVADRLPSGRPVRALHIGNFVGISLAYFSQLIVRRHPESLVVSVDPNVPHRGIHDPEAQVVALLHRFGLREANLVLTGYSLERKADAQSEGEYLAAGENVLGQLAVLGGRFDLVLLDGNHEGTYLRREVEALEPLLEDNAIVVFDDVRDWAGVAAVFSEVIDQERFATLGSDGRVGIVQLNQSKMPLQPL